MLPRALVLLVAPAVCAAWRREGTLPLSSHFTMYAGKFCFDYAVPNAEGEKLPPGALMLRMQGLTEDHGNGNTSFEGGTCIDGKSGRGCHMAGQLYLLGFSDEAHRWERVQGLWDELECDERLRYSSLAMPVSPRLSKTGAVDQVVPLELPSFNHTVKIMQKIRPRFWYFAFVNCGARIQQPVAYELHLWNENSGAEAELGVDMRGSQWLESAFAALFAVVSAIGTYAAVRSRPSQGAQGLRSRPLLLVLRASAALSALGCAARAAHHWVYLGDGYGLPYLGVAGSLFACGAKLLLTVLQFFIGKGWALFVSPGEAMQRRMIFVALLLVMGISAVCEIRAHYFHDMDTNFYLYASWPGLLILALNLSLLGASWMMTWDTYLTETSPVLRSYYRMVSLASGVYFASLPVISVVAGVLEPWVVRKMVERTEMGSRFVAMILLLACLWPSRVDALVAARLKNRTQVSLMKTDETCMEELGEATAPRQSEDAALNTQLG